MARKTESQVEQDIRNVVSKELGRAVSSSEWQSLKVSVDDAVEEYIEDPDDGGLEKRAKRMAKKLRERPQEREKIPLKLPETVLTDLDAAQAIARSYAIADAAASLPIVTQFRKDELNRRLLGRDDAIDYLAARLPNSSWYDYDPDAPDEYWSDREGWYWVPLAEHGSFAKAAQSLFVWLPTIDIPGDGTAKPMMDRFPTWVSAPVHGAARDLASLLPWTEGHAAWFLLTGGVPYVSPMKASVEVAVIVNVDGRAHLDRSTIRIECDAWVSPESVRRVSVHAQRDVLGQANKGTTQPSYEMYIVMAELKRRHGQRVPPVVVQETWQRYAAQRGGGAKSKDVSPGAIRRAHRRVKRALQRPIVNSSDGHHLDGYHGRSEA